MKRKFFAFLLITALLAGMLSGCADNSQTTDNGATNAVKPGNVDSEPVVQPGSAEPALESADSYRALLPLLRHNRNVDTGASIFNGVSAWTTTATDDVAFTEAVADAPAAGAADYSETNVQVAGIDEGDIVKTDGETIFVLHNGDVYLYRAAGAETAECARIDAPLGEDVWASDLYLSDGRLIVLGSGSAVCAYPTADGTVSDRRTDCTTAAVYDVTDPAAPKQLGTHGQDGYLTDSRLLDGTLYLITTYSVWSYDEDQPDTYVPRTYAGGKPALLPADCIYLPPVEEATSYTVVTAVDCESGAERSACAVLGWTGTVYMSQNNLYLAATDYHETVSDAHTEDVYTVETVTSSTVTNVTRIPLALPLQPAATGTVPGYLLNSYAMDEWNGHLRLVTTNDAWRYTIYTDEKHGWCNTVWDDAYGGTANGLYILDMDLAETGAVTDLAPGEQVYSCRFEGDYGYFVTYEQIDPLFCADLSDPASPQILSALKIPGFSQYLHRYGDGLLFGLGQNAEGVRTNGLKLSMFDTTDPADVTEKSTLLLDDSYSEALYNYHAILISPERNLIGLPVESGYVFYGYDAADGFFERSRVRFDDCWWGDARALFIGEDYYLVNYDGLRVLDADFTPVLTLAFDDGDVITGRVMID